jgi:hypothetical protein
MRIALSVIGASTYFVFVNPRGEHTVDQSNNEISAQQPQAKVLSFADALKKRSSSQAQDKSEKIEERKLMTQQKLSAANEASSFESELKKFEDTQRRLTEERLKANKNVLKSYKIKETKEDQ